MQLVMLLGIWEGSQDSMTGISYGVLLDSHAELNIKETANKVNRCLRRMSLHGGMASSATGAVASRVHFACRPGNLHCPVGVAAIFWHLFAVLLTALEMRFQEAWA